GERGGGQAGDEHRNEGVVRDRLAIPERGPEHEDEQEEDVPQKGDREVRSDAAAPRMSRSHDQDQTREVHGEPSSFFAGSVTRATLLAPAFRMWSITRRTSP